MKRKVVTNNCNSLNSALNLLHTLHIGSKPGISLVHKHFHGGKVDSLKFDLFVVGVYLVRRSLSGISS